MTRKKKSLKPPKRVKAVRAWALLTWNTHQINECHIYESYTYACATAQKFSPPAEVIQVEIRPIPKKRNRRERR